MRILGSIFLAIGFLWIVWDCAFVFKQRTYVLSIWHIQQLPPSETISREDAARSHSAMGDKLAARHGKVIIPALLMLLGGAILGVRQVDPKTEHTVEPNG